MKGSPLIGAAVLFLFALLLLFVALTPVYDSFMHPRFRPLTLLGGYLMMTLAVFSAGSRQYSIRPMQLLVLSFSFLVMGSAVVMQYPRNSELQSSFEDPEMPSSPESTFVQSGTPESLSPQSENGDYVHISIPELFLLTLDKKDHSLGMPVMLRGVALRREDLDQGNRIALGRVFLSCCAADSVRLIFFVDLPLDFDRSLIQDGSWLVVKGHVSGLPKDAVFLPEAGGLSPDSFSPTDIVNTEYILKAEEVTETREPPIFFTDTLRREEPYTF
ncbi:hypothetical protein [Marispirochaeta aestuarii]|uniref:hypothetical protein n=1 Tax=Marispirochaeta aestuarii TaxID=1963862 RepID=UPI002ABD3926|nr:hypothetical protein [Marispirochaeta aestuarii]